MSNRDNFGHDTTTDEVLEGIDLSGKLVLVTGGTSGLGVETARAMAMKGAQVITTGRDVPKGQAAADAINAATGKTSVEVEELELDSMDSCRKFADRFLTKHDSLDILINNAGIMACPFGKTQDGLELQFGTNHIGHFLMTCSIMPALLKGAPSRIVALSSRAHFQSPVVFDDLHFENREYDKFASYGQSKSSNVLFAVELERRLGSKGVHANAVHPGIIQTELGRHFTPEDLEAFTKRAAERGEAEFVFKTVEAGAATSVYAATAPELEGKGGFYLEDCHIAEVNDDPKAAEGVMSYALDPEAAKRLWAVSEEIIGEKFDF